MKAIFLINFQRIQTLSRQTGEWWWYLTHRVVNLVTHWGHKLSGRNAKLIGVLGSVLFLSFSILFLMFGKEHWSMLISAIICMGLSWKFSEQKGSKLFYLMDSGINLKLPESTICLPSRRGNCLVFLLKNGYFFLWKEVSNIT